MATLSNLTVVPILAPVSVTASNTGSTAIDLIKYVLKRQVKFVLDCVNTAGTNPTQDVKIQESPTTTAGDFTDVSGGAFTQVTGSSHQEIHCKLLPTTRYVRLVSTIGGTSSPAFTQDVYCVVENRLT